MSGNRTGSRQGAGAGAMQLKVAHGARLLGDILGVSDGGNRIASGGRNVSEDWWSKGGHLSHHHCHRYLHRHRCHCQDPLSPV
jgi:hypothetical protein